MQVSIYLNQREVYRLSPVATELGVGLSALCKAIIKDFLESHEGETPEQLASLLKSRLTGVSQIKSYMATGEP